MLNNNNLSNVRKMSAYFKAGCKPIRTCYELLVWNSLHETNQATAPPTYGERGAPKFNAFHSLIIQSNACIHERISNHCTLLRGSQSAQSALINHCIFVQGAKMPNSRLSKIISKTASLDRSHLSYSFLKTKKLLRPKWDPNGWLTDSIFVEWVHQI